MVVLSTKGGSKTSDQQVIVHEMEGKFIQLFSHSNVHIYFIEGDGKDDTKRDTTTVRLVMIPQEHQDAFSDVVIPPAFLEAGGWFYPLIPLKSPVYRTQEKYYIFPDLLSSPGSTVGIVMPEDITAEERDLFENILLNLAGLDEFLNGFDERCGIPGCMTGSIDTAAAFNKEESLPLLPAKVNTGDVPAAIVTAAEVAVDMAMGAYKRFEFMSFERGEAKFQLCSGFNDSKEYIGNAVEITGPGISRLADATSKLATFTSECITSAAAECVHDHSINGFTVMGASAVHCDATAGAMCTMGIVYESLHIAGKILAYAITHNNVMDQRYGVESSGSIFEYGPAAITAVNHN